MLLDGTDSQPVLMVCFNPEDQPNLSAFLSKGIMMLVSVFFLAMTLYIYFLIPDLRETQDKVTSIAVACLMVFMILMSMVQLAPSITFHPALCITMGKSVSGWGREFSRVILIYRSPVANRLRRVRTGVALIACTYAR